MTAFLRTAVALALSACIAGCATPTARSVPSAAVTPLRTKVIPADRARNAIAIGRSTRADVIAALGETLAITFDSGFEVWVYRLAGEMSGKGRPGARSDRERGDHSRAGEFVVLFSPSGVVAKTRIRPPLPNETADGLPSSG
jgi:hypothetical protein